ARSFGSIFETSADMVFRIADQDSPDRTQEGRIPKDCGRVLRWSYPRRPPTAMRTRVRRPRRRAEYSGSRLNCFKNLQHPDHRNLCFREYRAWLQRHISNHGWSRTRLEGPTRRGRHLVEFDSKPLRL